MKEYVIAVTDKVTGETVAIYKFGDKRRAIDCIAELEQQSDLYNIEYV